MQDESFPKVRIMAADTDTDIDAVSFAERVIRAMKAMKAMKVMHTTAVMNKKAEKAAMNKKAEKAMHTMTAMKASTVVWRKSWKGRHTGPWISWTLATLTFDEKHGKVNEVWHGKAHTTAVRAMKAMEAMQGMKAMKAKK